MPATNKFDLQILLVAITDYSVKEKSYESFHKFQAHIDSASIYLYPKDCVMELNVLRDPCNF